MVVASMYGKVYHMEGCCCGERILSRNRMEMRKKEAERAGLRQCKLCNKMSFHYNSELGGIDSYCRHNGMLYAMSRGELLVQTDLAFWRIRYYPDKQVFRLFHGNHKPLSKELHPYRMRDCHFQKDVPRAGSLMEYLKYIKKHDDFRRSAAENFRDLPQDTKKQKKYYRQAVNRKKREDRRRVFNLFEMLERKDPTLRQYSLCGSVV